MCLLIVWLVFSFNRLSRWLMRTSRLVTARVPFRLQPLAEARIMVGFGSDCLAAVERLGIGGSGNGRQIALAHINPNDFRRGLGDGIRRFHLQGDQQGEALEAPIRPEFGFADLSRLAHRAMCLS
jgi:hypothetical protein